MAIADYLDALIKDRKAYEIKLRELGISVKNLTFTEMNNRLKLNNIIFENGMHFQNFQGDSLFYEARNIKVDNMTSMINMFSNCKNLVSLDISNWNVSKVTNLDNMFFNCNNLSNESIESICAMCVNATAVTYKNLSNTNTYSPFYGTNKNVGNIINTTTQNLLRQGGWTW